MCLFGVGQESHVLYDVIVADVLFFDGGLFI